MICPNCGKSTDRTKEQKSKAIKAGLKKAILMGKTIGRPKTIDNDEVRFFRRKGLSLNDIAFKMGISKASVIRAIATGSEPVKK